ncbi:MAG: hypothetical protein ABI978_02250 [Chloroflexota bacterium]
MAMEHQPSGIPQAAGAGADASARALRVQMLATEHWSLLATRSLSWNEAFARASMFLSLLTGSVVALALVAQVNSFGDAVVLFALMALPVVLFVGLATYVRLLEINNEDYVWVRGMNRLRAAYLEIDPGLAPYFITGTTEDAAGIFQTFGSLPGTEGNLDSGLFHGFVTTPTTIAFVDAMLAGVLAAIVAVQLKAQMVPASAIGVVVFLVACGALAFFGYRSQVMAHLYPETRRADEDAPG